MKAKQIYAFHETTPGIKSQDFRMSRIPFVLVTVLFCAVCSLPLLAEDSPRTQYNAIYEQFMDLDKRQVQKSAPISDFSFLRDVAAFMLNKGELLLLAPVAGRPAALLFEGKGRFDFTPPTLLEQDQMYRVFEKRSLSEEFDRLFLLFTDSTWFEFERLLSFTEAENRQPGKYVEDGLKYLSNEDAEFFDTALMRAFLNKRYNGLFYAQMETDDHGPVFFQIDPSQKEEVRLLKRADTGHLYHVAEVVCQFNLSAGKPAYAEPAEMVRIGSYKIESKIEDNVDLDFSASADMEIHSTMADQEWIYLHLFSKLEIDSIFWQDSIKAEYYRGEENPVVWIKNDPPLARSEKRWLKIFYQGELFHRDVRGNIFIRSAINWYPKHGSRVPGVYELTYQTPVRFSHFISVGEQISKEKKEEYLITRWNVSDSINFAAFNIGDFDTLQFQDEENLPVKILAYQRRNAIDDVGRDALNSIALFRDIFGDPGIERFYVSETPYLHGMAFRGLIHLSSYTFRSTGGEGYDEAFRAHEVAHQWWGIAVDYATYHDKWLSEGLCNFAGLRYLQTVEPREESEEKYYDILDQYRENILTNRKYLLSDGQQAGPIWLGYRTSSSTTSGDYGLIIYEKGAWVFHMLRMMCADENNLQNDSLFNTILRDFYDSNRGKKVSTANFRQVVERHMKTDMDWFFDQWIYKTEIPAYTISYDTELTRDGKYKIVCHVRQSEVPGNFKMPLLIRIEFEEQEPLVRRVWITGRESKFELMIADTEPDELIFNYLNSVLAEVDYD